MNISDYYNKAKKIGALAKDKAPSILEALDYAPEDDHPSSWVPRVQTSLLNFYKEFPDSTEALELYVQGEIMDDSAERNMVVKVGFACLALGVIIGWSIWA